MFLQGIRLSTTIFKYKRQKLFGSVQALRVNKISCLNGQKHARNYTAGVRCGKFNTLSKNFVEFFELNWTKFGKFKMLIFK